jgi:hypothetical protein
VRKGGIFNAIADHEDRRYKCRRRRRHEFFNDLSAFNTQADDWPGYDESCNASFFIFLPIDSPEEPKI